MKVPKFQYFLASGDVFVNFEHDVPQFLTINPFISDAQFFAHSLLAPLDRDKWLILSCGISWKNYMANGYLSVLY
jgi:hypothetical protein